MSLDGGNGRVVFVPLVSGVRGDFGGTGFLGNIRISSLHHVASLISYSRLPKSYWTWVQPSQLWYPYRFCSRLFDDVPARRLVLTWHDSAVKRIPWNAVDPMCVVCRQNHCFLGFKIASSMVRGMYVETVYDVVPVVYNSSVSGHVEDDEKWSWSDISPSKRADVRESFHVDVTTIQRRCRELSLAVPDIAGLVFELSLRCRDVVQELEEAGTLVAVLPAPRAEQFTKIDALQSHNQELLDENLRLEHQVRLVRVEEELHTPRDVDSTKAVTNAKV